MVGHKHEGMNGYAVVARGYLQPVQVTIVIVVGKETSATIVTTLNDVLRQSGLIDARPAGHALV
jgi:hypothetical protein